jgi:hypothetical protein
MSEESKWLRAENTFLLALDGDIDFQPSAVMLLIDLMKRDLRVGAACGRIHPIGSGKHNIDPWWHCTTRALNFVLSLRPKFHMHTR